jgi:hypothetical protein
MDSLARLGETIDQFVAIEDYFGLISRIVQVEPWRIRAPKA